MSSVQPILLLSGSGGFGGFMGLGIRVLGVRVLGIRVLGVRV